MSRAEFRQTAMIAAMEGLLMGMRGWNDDSFATELARRAVLIADALVEANTIDEGVSDATND